MFVLQKKTSGGTAPVGAVAASRKKFIIFNHFEHVQTAPVLDLLINIFSYVHNSVHHHCGF